MIRPRRERGLQRLAGALVRHSPAISAVEPRLNAALTQLLGRPGKLLRGQMVFLAAKHHGLSVPAAEKLACAIEYFHSASLVLDDLPCMDDAIQRRGLPCIHRHYGDATAILAALALINRAYALIGEALRNQPRRVRMAASSYLDRCLGVNGLVGGQAWDLAYHQSDRSPRLIGRIAAAKTGALFALAVLLPATLARPTAPEQRALRTFCVYWGQIFQITDDLNDVAPPDFPTGKTAGRDHQLSRPNLAIALGVTAARARLARLTAQANRTLAALTAKKSHRWDYLATTNEWLGRLLAVPANERSAAA